MSACRRSSSVLASLRGNTRMAELRGAGRWGEANRSLPLLVLQTTRPVLGDREGNLLGQGMSTRGVGRGFRARRAVVSGGEGS